MTERLLVDTDVAVEYLRDRPDASLPDALIAATAKAHEAALVTFNTKHFPMLEDVQAPYSRPG